MRMRATKIQNGVQRVHNHDYNLLHVAVASNAGFSLSFRYCDDDDARCEKDANLHSANLHNKCSQAQ